MFPGQGNGSSENRKKTCSKMRTLVSLSQIALLLHSGFLWNACMSQQFDLQEHHLPSSNKSNLRPSSDVIESGQKRVSGHPGQQRKLDGIISINTQVQHSNPSQQQLLSSIYSILDDSMKRNAVYGEKNNTIILHVGPMKTGTSTVQQLLRAERDMLKLDRYETISSFIPTGSGLNNEAFVVCFMPDHPDCSHHLNNSVYEVGNVRNNHFVMTAEGFFHPANNIEWIKNYITSGWKHHQIVITYRRYYDWLLSFHNQSFKRREPPKRISIVDYVTRVYDNHQNNQLDFVDSYYVLDEIERYSQHFEQTNIRIINLPGINRKNQSLEEEFVCRVIPNAPHACSHYVTENSNSLEKKNTHHSLVYEELAFYAREHNLWQDRDSPSVSDVQTKNSVLSLPIVAALARTRHEITMGKQEFEFDDLYIECLPEPVFEWLLQYSLQAEEQVVPEYFNRYGRNEIYYDLKHSDFRSRFCHVKTESIILYDPEWKEFFRSL